MRVSVNGQELDLEEGATVASVVALLEVAPEARGVAVAVDGVVVVRGQWSTLALVAGAQVEVLSAIGGG